MVFDFIISGQQHNALSTIFFTFGKIILSGFFIGFISGWLIGDKMTYVDLSLFQVVQGLRYAFPKGFKKYEKRCLSVLSLNDKVFLDNKVSEYLSSDRRIPFNKSGVFRYYPELDK